jgi:hypothetical protein
VPSRGPSSSPAAHPARPCVPTCARPRSGPGRGIGPRPPHICPRWHDRPLAHTWGTPLRRAQAREPLVVFEQAAGHPIERALGRPILPATDGNSFAAGGIAVPPAHGSPGIAGRVAEPAGNRGREAAGRVVVAPADHGVTTAGRVIGPAADRGWDGAGAWADPRVSGPGPSTPGGGPPRREGRGEGPVASRRWRASRGACRTISAPSPRGAPGVGATAPGKGRSPGGSS